MKSKQLGCCRVLRKQYELINLTQLHALKYLIEILPMFFIAIGDSSNVESFVAFALCNEKLNERLPLCTMIEKKVLVGKMRTGTNNFDYLNTIYQILSVPFILLLWHMPYISFQ